MDHREHKERKYISAPAAGTNLHHKEECVCLRQTQRSLLPGPYPALLSSMWYGKRPFKGHEMNSVTSLKLPSGLPIQMNADTQQNLVLLTIRYRVGHQVRAFTHAFLSRPVLRPQYPLSRLFQVSSPAIYFPTKGSLKPPNAS